MKLLKYITLLSLSVTICYGQQDWYWQNPKPQGNTYNDIYAINDNEIIVIGNLGTIYKSSDAGRNWHSVNDPNFTIENLHKVFFLNQSVGWCVGDNGMILKTTNRGENWFKQTSYHLGELTDVFFDNENTGYTCGSSLILKTTNAGGTWLHYNSNLESNLYSLNFTNSFTGWVISTTYNQYGRSSIYKTTDGGYSWSSQLQAKVFNQIQMINENTGYAVGRTGFYMTFLKLYKTTNAGANWQTVPIDSTWFMEHIHFTNELTGYASGGNRLYRTTDGALSWHIDYLPDFFSNVSISNPPNLWGVSYNKIYKSVNAGSNWQQASSGFNNYSIYSVFFLDKNTGWISNEINGLMKSTDGGFNWVFIDTGYSTHFSQMIFKDAVTGFASSYGSDSLYRSDNGGYTWTPKKTLDSFSCDVFSVQQENVILASGQKYYPAPPNNYFLKSFDLGESWVVQVVDTNYSTYNQIYFLDINTGWYLTRRNLYKTTNSGSSWVPVLYQSGWNTGFSKFSVLDKNNLWIYNDTGSVYITSNGGSNWNVRTLPDFLYGNLNTLKVIDEHSAIMIGGPKYLITTNSGESWITKYIPTGTIYNSYFLDNQTGWVAGSNGTLLKTTNGGGLFVNNISLEDIPKNYFLSQNYPNPFNPNTTIKFELPNNGLVKLIIYDILGRQVTELINDVRGPGIFTVDWNASGIASGIYFIRLELGTYSMSRKMILIK